MDLVELEDPRGSAAGLVDSKGSAAGLADSKGSAGLVDFGAVGFAGSVI